MPVSFEELAPSPVLHVTRRGQGSSGTRIFLIDWADYPEFLGDILGRQYVVGGEVVIDTAVSTFPGAPKLIADEVSIESFDERPGSHAVSLSGTHNSYQKAKVTVQYRPLEASDSTNPPDSPEVPSGTFLEFTSEGTGEFLTVPGTGWKWSNGDPLSPEANKGIIVGSETFSFTWSRVPQPPWSTITAAKGKLNQGSFAGHAEGHVLFLGAQRRKAFDINPDAQTLWTLTYQFKARSQDWRKSYRSEPAGEVGWKFVSDANGAYPYQLTDFQSLFQF